MRVFSYELSNCSAEIQELPELLKDLIFFRRHQRSFDDRSETEKLKNTPADFNRIRCPLCRWQPKKSSRWICSDYNSHFGCGTEWNTFKTRGRCPGCDYQWTWTDCLRCFRSSPHEAWYENDAN